ncbi:MAG TPA: class I adenylate-forming enzyme family protein [Microthrixaceae bacterium]|nr:class I adenylate-forming enzyme family protein [Microthrixaceae bacterium]
MNEGNLSRDDVIAGLTASGSMFEVGEAEVQGRSTPVWAAAPSTLRDVLLGTRAHGERDFLVFGDERWTFDEHLRLVAGLAQWMARERRVAKGDRVAIGMRNYPEFIITFWATQVLGAVVVPLNAWWTGPELDYAIGDSGAALAVVDGERYDRMSGDLEARGVPAVVVRHDGQLAAGDLDWDEVPASLDPAASMPDGAIHPDDDATIVYTSGTTGVPKGAVGTHRNHVSTFFNTAFNGAVGAALARARGSTRPSQRASYPQCALLTYPFFHIGGLNTICINTGFAVKTVLQYKWDLEEALALIERERVTNMAAVPTLLRQLLESPLLEQYDVSSLGTLASGGAPVPPDLVERIDTTFASSVAPSNGYGLTETTGAVTLNVGKDYLGHSSSVGACFPVTRVRGVDPANGTDVVPGEVGELWFSGPTVSRGYWNMEAATAEAFTDGWFHSGDLGRVDEDGYVYVVDRLKDVIIRGGENVYCAEIEAALFAHPAVGDVAVIGLPDAELGEEVAAVVVLKEGATVSARDLQEHVAARLAYFKVPSTVLFRTDPLPRNATGKLLKRELRAAVA